MERLELFTIGECQEIPVKPKKRPLMERLNEQIQPINEKYDRFGDDVEEDL